MNMRLTRRTEIIFPNVAHKQHYPAKGLQPRRLIGNFLPFQAFCSKLSYANPSDPKIKFQDYLKE